MAEPFTRRTVTVGKFSTLEAGVDLGVDISVKSTAPILVWAATGDAYVSEAVSTTAPDGGVASIALIPTDLSGWLINGEVVDVSNGQQSHTYDVTVQPTRGGVPVGDPLTYTNVAVASGTTALDLDTAASVVGATGVQVSIPDYVAELEAAAGTPSESAIADMIGTGGVLDDALATFIADHTTTGGGGTASLGTEVYLSTFTGATDDDKLTAAMNAVKALTLKGVTIVLDENRDYTFTQSHTLYNGFSLRGTHRPQDQARSSEPIGNRVLLRMSPAGSLFTLASDVFGVSVTNLSIDGNSSSRLVGGTETSGHVLWTSVFRDISAQNCASLLGQKNNRLLVTACTVDGWWNINNVQERAFAIGGSDFYFNPTMMLLDSPDTLLAATEYLGSFEYQSNMWVKNIYCTADGHSGLFLTGGTTSALSNWIKDCVFEGRNASAPCPGALIRVTGGQWSIRDCRFGFAMSNPTATGRNDGGAIHVSSGTVFIDGVTWEPIPGNTQPLVYVTGGKVRIRNVTPVGATSTKPVVHQTAAGLIDADDSVTLTGP